MSKKLTHVSSDGMPTMVDVGDKQVTTRHATALARLRFPQAVLETLKENNWEAAKGAVLPTAIIAGVQAVKKTSDLIPFCHPLPVEGVKIVPEVDDDGLSISCSVRVTHKTGVEMEALTGASVAALTVIDMCKALSPEIEIESVKLISKTGGKKDFKAS
jgi:cyclic pyranopterin phosphate synthase